MNERPYFVTWSAQRDAKTVPILGGSGAHFEVRAHDGVSSERWLDFASLQYQATLGHGERRILDALKKQVDTLVLTAPNGEFEGKAELARSLLDHAPPGFDRVFFTLGGAEAVENAIKMVRLATGRHKLISRYRSYHGATMGALTLSGDHRRPPLEPGLVGVTHVLDCFESRLPGGSKVIEGGGSAEGIARVLELEKDVAGVFLEPVPGANGVLIPPAGYWATIREACDRHGALLVSDCVLDGFGRLGQWYGFEAFGVSPDLITLSKGLTGGYAPLGAVLVHQRVSAYFDERVLWAGLTFYGHPLGIAAARAAMAIYESDRLIERAAALGAILETEIAAIQDRRSIPRTRSLGMLAALELESVDALERVASKLEEKRIAAHVYPRIRALVISPPLVISESDLRGGLAELESIVAERA